MNEATLYRCLSEPYQDTLADGLQFWAEDPLAALEYGLPSSTGAPRYMVEAHLTIERPLLLDSDDAARDAAALLGTRWSPANFYSDVLDAPGARDRLLELGYDGVVMDDGSGRIGHRTHVTLTARQVRVIRSYDPEANLSMPGMGA